MLFRSILLPLKLSNQIATLLERDALEVSLEARAAKVLLGAVGHDLHVRDILAKERVLIRGSGVAITISPPKVTETRVLQLGLVLVTKSCKHALHGTPQTVGPTGVHSNMD